MGLSMWATHGELFSVKPMVSGGQRQRIALIRAILANTPIVFLDEATSAMDAFSDQRILGFLMDLWRDKTLIYISHKPLPPKLAHLFTSLII